MESVSTEEMSAEQIVVMNDNPGDVCPVRVSHAPTARVAAGRRDPRLTHVVTRNARQLARLTSDDPAAQEARDRAQAKRDRKAAALAACARGKAGAAE